jgi:hypothetical protein
LGCAAAPKAMTSQMMANDSKRKGQGVNITVSSTSFGNLIGNNNTNASNTNQSKGVQNQTNVISNANQFQNSNTNQLPLPPPMKGFVRSESDIMQQSYIPPPHSIPVKKKSRWDN